MENYEEKKSIIIRQGSGDDAMEMTVLVTQEELDKMEQIRRFSPENWEGKDLELLKEARKVIEEDNAMKTNGQKQNNEASKQNSIKTVKRSNKGLFLVVIILFIIIVGLAASYAINNSTKRIILQQNQNYTTKNFSSQGVSFDYPGNWTFKMENSNNSYVFMIYGWDDNEEAEINILVLKNLPNKERERMDALILELVNSDEVNDLEYSSLYNVKYSEKKAIALDCFYTRDKRRHYASIIGFTSNNSTFIIIKSASSEYSLNNDDFKIMEKSFKITF